MVDNNIIVFDIFKDIVNKTVAKKPGGGLFEINFQAGKPSQILKSIAIYNESSSFKDKKYPLIALYFPFVESRTRDGFYSNLRIPKISIMTYTTQTDSTQKRYEEGGTFKSILYPVYYGFLKSMVKSKYIIEQDAGAIQHRKVDQIGTSSDGSTDYVDSIDIFDLEITLNQNKNC